MRDKSGETGLEPAGAGATTGRFPWRRARFSRSSVDDSGGARALEEEEVSNVAAARARA
jgi:hypothetical protein